jgi:very-short-patch-repair endonuclease
MSGKLSLRPSAPTTPSASGWAVSPERLERLKERARVLRRDPGEAEQALWARLAGGKVGGLKFSHKTVVGSAIVDFACSSRWVVVSLSGEGSNPEVDALQDRRLAEAGIRVLRFTETEALEDTDRVVHQIASVANQPFQRPGRSRG